jgi:aspartyl/asparaginyl beta-hydroxylase (cupin superfamily)
MAAAISCPPLSTSRTHHPSADERPLERLVADRLEPCIARVAPSCEGWRLRKKKKNASTALVAAKAEIDASAPAPSQADPATPLVLSRTPKFAPWLRQLEGQLLNMALQVVRETTGERVESGCESADEDEIATERELEIRKQREMGSTAYSNQHMEGMRRLGGSLGKLVELIQLELLPRMPSDPEALFLAASAAFISRKFTEALTLMQTGMMAVPDGHLSAKDHAARHYFVALIALRLISEADTAPKGEDATGKMDLSYMAEERKAELCGIIERGLSEALRLDPRLHSAYIDAEMLAQIRFPVDAHARVAQHAKLVEAACKTGKFWVSPMQRPMHFYPKLRSQPWWDASDFPWTLKLMTHFQEIREEVLKMRGYKSDGKRHEWDAVGSKHDAGDRELVENGAWTELVLLNRDEKVATQVGRNRRLCPVTLRILDSIPEAADMAKRGCGESTFSALHGGAHLKPHCGSTNCRLTCHLPLLCPSGCSIRVGDEERPYREGELMIFDDSWEHEVWQRNKPASVRVVLLIRFWHPDIAPARYPEAFHHMKKSYLQHKRRILVPPLKRPTKDDVTPQLELTPGLV